jgi:CRP/FNR family cyclic AMP-dependent transcriptional regulator
MAARANSGMTEALAAVPLFSGCTKKELAQIAGLGAVVTVADGATLTAQGHLGREFVMVLSGRARCLIDGEEVAAFGPGDYFGELSLLDGGPRTATVIAEGDGQIVVLDQREFFELLDVSPSIAKKLLIELAGRQRRHPTDPWTS